jgi:lipoyl(octanoyl) transferase
LNHQLQIKHLGSQDYQDAWNSMRSTISAKTQEDKDEVWLLEHPPVFTIGHAGSKDNLLESGAIPVIRSDRGGEITFHGPGQLVVYFMINLKRLGWGPKRLVQELEELIICLLEQYGIEANRKEGFPGIYVESKKIASIGLKINRGFSYHGISLNVDMDMSPFQQINPCGISSLELTQMKDLTDVSMDDVRNNFANTIESHFRQI